jgi:hypothetical protein
MLNIKSPGAYAITLRWNNGKRKRTFGYVL